MGTEDYKYDRTPRGQEPAISTMKLESKGGNGWGKCSECRRRILMLPSNGTLQNREGRKTQKTYRRMREREMAEVIKTWSELKWHTQDRPKCFSRSWEGGETLIMWVDPQTLIDELIDI